MCAFVVDPYYLLTYEWQGLTMGTWGGGTCDTLHPWSEHVTGVSSVNDNLHLIMTSSGEPLMNGL